MSGNDKVYHVVTDCNRYTSKVLKRVHRPSLKIFTPTTRFHTYMYIKTIYDVLWWHTPTRLTYKLKDKRVTEEISYTIDWNLADWETIRLYTIESHQTKKLKNDCIIGISFHMYIYVYLWSVWFVWTIGRVTTSLSFNSLQILEGVWENHLTLHRKRMKLVSIRGKVYTVLKIRKGMTYRVMPNNQKSVEHDRLCSWPCLFLPL